MKINKIFGLRMVVLTMCFIGSALANDGAVNFRGSVTDTTCNISVNGGDFDGFVELPSVSASLLNDIGKTAGTTPFTIALSNCSGSTLGSAYTFFAGGLWTDLTTGRLNGVRGGPSEALNVQLELLNNVGQQIFISDEASQRNDVVNISSGSGVMNYSVRYYAIGAATTGKIESYVEYSIVYL